jgi:hypothetical protein
MALVRQPTRITFKFRDRSRQGAFGFFMGEDGGSTPDPIQLGNPNALAPFSYLQEFYQSLQNASDCAGVGYEITYSWQEEPSLSSYGATPDMNRKGVLTFNAGRTPSLFTIPGIKDAAFDSTGRKIARAGSTFQAGASGDIATHLQSIHDKLQNGATIGLNTYPVVDEEGNDWDGLVDAFKQNRASSGRGRG